MMSMENKSRIPIAQYTMDGEFLRNFDSYWSAAAWIMEHKYTTSTNQN